MRTSLLIPVFVIMLIERLVLASHGTDIRDEIIFEKPEVKSAGLQANISMIIHTSGTFTSLYNLVFFQNEEIILTQPHHPFYAPGVVHKWTEAFNISDFYYRLHSIDPALNQTTLTWQLGIPPHQGSTYGMRSCHHTERKCVRRNCLGCPWTEGWLVCDGYLNCSGEERTWVYNDEGCNNDHRDMRILCGDEREGIILPGIGVSGRRNFSFWTVARHRLRKFIFGGIVG